MKILHLIRRITRAVLPVATALGRQTAASAQGVPQELTLDHPQVKAVISIQNSVTTEMMKLPGLLGTAVGLDNNGAAALVVYVDQDSPSRAEIMRSLPPP